MYANSIPENAGFDYVVVGSGSAGCALANRLSEDGSHQVLLLEAGGRDDTYKIHVPLMVAHVLNDTRWTWQYQTEPQLNLNGQRTKWARGRVLGGSSSINGMIFVRGDHHLYDAWRDEMGCTGWGYQDLLPIFKRLEDCPDGDASVRGRGGPIHCTMLKHFDALSDAYLAACGEMGYKVSEDYNDGINYEGAFNVQLSTRRGFRNSAAVGYLAPARNRPNLTVLPNAVAVRVLLDGKRATGIEYRQGEATRKVLARREVVLSAGPMASPHLLELSGIGNSDILQQHGIGVVHHLPGVGENLSDHPNTRLTFECSQPITINDVLRSPWLKFKEGLKFAFKRGGLLSVSSSTVQAHVRSSPLVDTPDLVLRLQPLSGKDRYARTPDAGLDPFPGFTIGVTLIRPRSLGSLHIQSRDPLQPVKMDPRYLSHEADTQLFLDGVRLARKLSQQPSLQPLVVRETRPGPEVEDDAGLLEYVRSTVQTACHQVGTCKMGIDSAAVVDPELRVHGIADLRVVDSSIFPTIPSANTNIPSIATGEKGADFILAAARGQA